VTASLSPSASARSGGGSRRGSLGSVRLVLWVGLGRARSGFELDLVWLQRAGVPARRRDLVVPGWGSACAVRVQPGDGLWLRWVAFLQLRLRPIVQCR
jgi:hypothetical protein